LKKYKLKIQEKIPIFVEVADLANAYKHCVRENGKGKNSNLPWAKDLQQPKFTVNIQIPNGEVITKKEQIVVQADYDFSWPIDSHEKAITEIFQLLIKYENSNELMFNIV
jgi:regulator of protease activity HflC (stomatin/prohibitin superfamily)